MKTRKHLIDTTLQGGEQNAHTEGSLHLVDTTLREGEQATRLKVRKHLVDTTLRDGEQSPFVSFSRRQKLKVIELLLYAGVRQIEAGVPASSSYEKETICKIVERKGAARILVWSRLNIKDVQGCLECHPDIVHISIPTSNEHIYSKLGKDTTWVMKQLYTCIELVGQSNCQISIGLEDAFRADPTFLLTLMTILIECRVSRVRIADTLGTATPSTCRALVDTLSLGGKAGGKLAFHAHNDLGLALANTLEALKAGCSYADTTLFGIGERAGNCDFAKLIRVTEDLFDWGITAAGAEYVQEEFALQIQQP